MAPFGFSCLLLFVEKESLTALSGTRYHINVRKLSVMLCLLKFDKITISINIFIILKCIYLLELVTSRHCSTTDK